MKLPQKFMHSRFIILTSWKCKMPQHCKAKDNLQADVASGRPGLFGAHLVLFRTFILQTTRLLYKQSLGLSVEMVISGTNHQRHHQIGKKAHVLHLLGDQSRESKPSVLWLSSKASPTTVLLQLIKYCLSSFAPYPFPINSITHVKKKNDNVG